MQLDLVAKVLVLLAVANGAPIIVKRLLGDTLAYPLDAGRKMSDGQPLLGSSKTIRGVAAGIIATMLVAPLLGFVWMTGLIVGAAAMAGDLISSFVKRRMGLPPSARAFGLDHIPESLLPALAAMTEVDLTLADVLVITVAFTLGGQALSLLLYKMRLRDHPY
jgi:CDP-archaeol synthase